MAEAPRGENTKPGAEALHFSTGLPALDEVVDGLRAGDNVVWEIGAVRDYRDAAAPFVDFCRREQRTLVYYRFARHEPMLPDDAATRVVRLDPAAGFEHFLDVIHDAVRQAGRGACHVFDCLSELAADWYSDQMVGNFFQLTCPYLYELDTIAYFSLMRDYHSTFALSPIMDTTQLMLELYRHEGRLYVQPSKVQGRSSPRMFMLHVLDGERAEAVTDSATTAHILRESRRSYMGVWQTQLGVWTRTFVEAERLLERKDAQADEVNELRLRILRMAVSRDERVLKLADRYFSLEDLVAIGKRLLGTGLIGGKSVGMLLARAILMREDKCWADRLEIHDSFYIPSDVFYTFLVRNGCWRIRKRQLQTEDFLEGSEEARSRILSGTFPRHIIHRFMDMLEYFGQSPIIVRSSSLLEDNFGNSFAGKYASEFCTSQGSPRDRLECFVEAVKTVYASAVSKPALEYRARYGLLDMDEQMALLVQRVSGAQHGPHHFPQAAGVGLSFNPYIWDPDIDPEAGMLRLVFGLGTRAVDRADDDYTRIVALNAPERRPETQRGEAARYAQHKVDVLDLEGDGLTTLRLEDLKPHCGSIPMNYFLSRDATSARRARQSGMEAPPPMLSFDGLLRNTDFVPVMKQMLETLHRAYNHAVDIEFAVNFHGKGGYTINLVQCRPFQIRGGLQVEAPPEDLRTDDVLLESSGPVVGKSRAERIERVVYVVPSRYSPLPEQKKYAVARLIGRINSLRKDGGSVMLLGPGRWGTTTPSLGVPVHFGEINRVDVLCEIVAMREDLVPDVSFGTHFFSEMVEADMLYLACHPKGEGHVLREDVLLSQQSRTAELVGAESGFEDVVRVLDFGSPGADLRIHADTLKQRVLCYLT